MFTQLFINRPIFASVLSILITLAGGVALFALPIAQYPEITPPTVEVSAVFPGANAKTVADTVAAPIEQQVNGVEDMMYMSSRSTNDGAYTLTVTFKPGADLNIAQVLVQNRVSLALPVLPELVRRRGVSVKKKSPTVLMIVNLYSPDGSRDNLALSNYATIQLRDELARVEGVGDITYLGQRDFSMRLWLDPEKMTARNLSSADVIGAIEQQNIQAAAGQVGQPPVPQGQVFQFTIHTLGRLDSEEAFGNIILKTDNNGRVVRVRDVARVELGAIGYDQSCMLDGQPSVALSVYQLPGSNAIETAKRIRTKMTELKSKFSHGIDYDIVYDTTPFIDESVLEVFKTLRDAVILVAAVMLLFLQSWRAAAIPLAAVPVAIVGTFAAMWGLGYSLNNLTLFGLVLAVGIVVDDAIVVVEAVQHHIEHGLPPSEAASKAMSEVAGPVIAVGLVLAAVFVPCIFITGIIGQFFRQFAVTIAISTLISVFNSLTLSPALCALLLRSNENEKREPLPPIIFPLIIAFVFYFFGAEWLNSQISSYLPPSFVAWGIAGWIAPAICGLAGAIVGWTLATVFNRILAALFDSFNRAFTALTESYLKFVSLALKLSFVVLAGYGGLLYLTFLVLDRAPSGFIPSQDKGYLLVNVQLPDSASLIRTNALIQDIEAVARKTPGVRHTVAISGQSILLGANAPNFGTLYVMLDPFSDRHEREKSANEIVATLQAKFREETTQGLVDVFGAPSVDGLSAAGGFTLVIEDPANSTAAELQKAAVAVSESAPKSPSVRDAFSGFRADTPWLDVNVDRIAAKSMGVSVSDVINTLQTYFGSLYVNDFNLYGRTWQVNVQADGKFRQQEEDLKKLRVKNAAGRMVPVSAFLSVKETSGPVMLQRYNLYPSANVTITPAEGASSGQVIAGMDAIAKEALPPSMRSEWTELALLQLQTKDTAARAFILAVVLAFLVLAAQYESWTLPLAVILVVPLCLLCAAIGMILAQLEINIFTQVGFVVLVGLACKNAILIVEFAKVQRDSGLDRRQATLDACRLRLRPIIMTSVAFILGVAPLVMAHGAGAEMRRSLGTAVFAGMIGVTIFGIFLTPVFYYVIQFFKDLRQPKKMIPEPAVENVIDQAH